MFIFIAMKEIIVQLPKEFDFTDSELKRFFAAKLFESGRLSLGQAAEMSQLSKVAFSEILADYNISLINYSEDEMIEDATRF